jgi:GTP-binding protein Era
MEMTETFKSGFVALIGRPNVGKSTILNAILERKIAITTDRQQTTRNRILGIKTLEHGQIIFVDTPGIHNPHHALGEAMVRTAQEVIRDVDSVVFVTDAEVPAAEDQAVFEMLSGITKPVFFVLNKADKKSPSEITRILNEYSGLFSFAALLSVSGLKNKGTGFIVERLMQALPDGPKYYDDDMITDQYERFMAAEIVREKIIKNTSEEVPHAAAVEVLEWKQKKNGLVVIRCVIYVERDGQKGIIIGKNGEKLKKIGRQARIDIEKLIGAKVFLELRVKVKKDWRDDKKMLQTLGY